MVCILSLNFGSRWKPLNVLTKLWCNTDIMNISKKGLQEYRSLLIIVKQTYDTESQ